MRFLFQTCVWQSFHKKCAPLVLLHGKITFPHFCRGQLINLITRISQLHSTHIGVCILILGSITIAFAKWKSDYSPFVRLLPSDSCRFCNWNSSGKACRLRYMYQGWDEMDFYFWNRNSEWPKIPEFSEFRNSEFFFNKNKYKIKNLMA